MPSNRRFRETREGLSVELARDRGVPFTIATHRPVDPRDLFSTIEYDRGDGRNVAVVSRRKQLDAFESALRRPFSAPYCFVVTGAASDSYPKLVAFEIFKAAFARTRDDRLPLWWTVTGGLRDRLRDDDEWRAGIRAPNLLVISGVADNSINLKFEKVRDIVAQFDDIPKVIVGTGASPLELVGRHLQVAVQRVAYFS